MDVVGCYSGLFSMVVERLNGVLVHNDVFVYKKGRHITVVVEGGRDLKLLFSAAMPIQLKCCASMTTPTNVFDSYNCIIKSGYDVQITFGVTDELLKRLLSTTSMVREQLQDKLSFRYCNKSKVIWLVWNDGKEMSHVQFSTTHARRFVLEQSGFVPPFYIDDLLHDETYAEDVLFEMYTTQESNLYAQIVKVWYTLVHPLNIEQDDSNAETMGMDDGKDDDDLFEASLTIPFKQIICSIARSCKCKVGSISCADDVLIDISASDKNSMHVLVEALTSKGLLKGKADWKAKMPTAAGIKSISLTETNNLHNKSISYTQQLDDSFVINPLTGHPIKSNGSLAKQLRRRGILK